MGITKKAVLASLVCLMMSLAFLIGLMPSREAVDVTAASRSNGRVDMVDLLNAVLNLKSASEATEIAVSEPPDGALFRVPTDAPRGLINAASVTVPDGEGADDVLLGVDGVFDPINHTWTGDTHSDLLGFGNYSRGFVNIAGLTAEAHKMYALGFATADPFDTARYIYGGTPDPVWSGDNSTEFTVDVVSAGLDSDDNGLPDLIDYFVSDLSLDGLQWVSSDAAASRTVTVANLNVASAPKSNGMVAVCPTPGVFVYCPSLTALKAADVLYDDTWAAWIIAWGAESPDLDKMIDSSDAATWADNLEQKAELHSSKTPPSYLGLALAYFRFSTGMEMPFVTGPLPAEVAIHVVFENVATDTGETVSLWSVPAGLDATDPEKVILVGDSTPDLDWTKKVDMIQDPDVPTTYSAELTTFSIMAPFTPPVLSVTPANRGVAAEDAGDTTFDIAFTSGTPAWTAVVVSGNTWLTIDQASGTGNATLTASFEPNVDVNPRVGQITVTAEDAEGSPVTVTVTQEGMTLEEIAAALLDNFDSLDANGDGLTLDESGLSSGVFDDLDTDDNGVLTRAELRGAFPAIDVSPIIDSIEPNEAWLFGGVKAVITGQSFYPDTEVTVAGQAVDPIAITDTQIYLIIPALEETLPGEEGLAVIERDVTVTNPVAKSSSFPKEFFYKRFETKVYPDGDQAVSTTAFILDSTMSPFTTALALYKDISETSEPSYAYLTLPLPPSTPDSILKVYGLARATSNAVMKAMDTYSASLYSDLIQVDPPYKPIPNVWDFAIHLYKPDYNTEPIWNTFDIGSKVYDEFSDFAYNTSPAELQFPVANTCETLAAVNIAASLYMYSAETRYDYATDTTSFSTPALPPSVGQYQLTPDDFIIFDSVAARDTVVTKLYDLGGVFSLRYTPSAPSVTPDNQDVGAAAGSTTFDIAIASFAPPNTSNWTATPEDAWLTLPQPSGAGDATLTVNFGANLDVERIGHITVAFDCAEVAPQVVTVTQACGVAPELSVTPLNQDVGAAAGSTTFAIANTGCGTLDWTAVVVSGNTWLTIDPASGTGGATLTANFDPNTGLVRTGSITITSAGVAGSPITVTVTQACGVAPELSVTPLNRDVGVAAGSTTFDITTTGCAPLDWTAAVDPAATWLTIDPASGTGAATLTANFEANTGPARTGSITITSAGSPVTVTVNQEACGVAPELSVTPLNRDVGVAAGSTTFDITTTGCAPLDWTAVVDPAATWLTIDPASGTGAATLTANFEANTGPARTGSITITSAGSPVTVTVNQEACGLAPELSVTPLSQDVGAAAGSTTFAIANTGCGTLDWTAAVDPAATWLMIDQASGTGGATLTANFELNAGLVRTGSITITSAGAAGSPITVTVTQGGAILDVQPLTGLESCGPVGVGPFEAAFVNYVLQNTGTAALEYSVSKGADWVGFKLTPDAPLSAVVAGTLEATAAVTLGVYIDQDAAAALPVDLHTDTVSFDNVTTGGGSTTRDVALTVSAPPALTVTPDDRSVGAAADTTTFDISITGCALEWTATVNPGYAWLTVAPGAGSGNAILTASFDPNMGAARVGYITVAAAGGMSKEVTVTQAACSLPTVLTVTPANRYVGAAATSTTFDIAISGCSLDWTATAHDAWLSVVQSTGTGNAILTASFGPNTGDARTGRIAVASADGASWEVVTVTQACGFPTVLTVTPGNQDVGSAAGTTTFDIAITGCALDWAVVAPADAWLRVAPVAGAGNAPLTANFDANTGDARTGHITVMAAGGVSKEVTVTQAALVPNIIGPVVPASAWVFGGVIARIEGSDFAPDAVVTFGGVVAEKVTGSGSTIDVIVPPVAEFAEAFQPVSVKVTNGAATASNAQDFTYLHYQKAGDVVTTAFTVTDTAPTKPIALDIVKSLVTDEASLTLPLADANLGATSSAYVLVRATKTPALVGTGGVPGTAVLGAWDFSIHVYDPTDNTLANTGTISSGYSVYGEAHPTFTRGVTTGAQLTMPVSLAPADNIVSVWAVETPDYDYGRHPADEDATSGVSPKAQYIVPITEITEPPTGTVTVHLYDFSSFTLRKNSGEIIPLVLTPDNGPNCGGTLVKITCDAGGLGSATGVKFRDSKATIQAVVNECEIEVETPGVGLFAGKVDVEVCFGGTADDPKDPSVIKPKEDPEAFAYYGADGAGALWAGLLIALGAMLLGYTQGYTAPGGGGGGGGGGGCFIATAAYGTPMAADIDTLRAFRDTYLLSSSSGTAFVDAYYRVSPFIANVVAQSPFLAAVVRLLLAPVIFGLKTPLTMMVLLSIGAMMVAVRKHLRRKA